MLLLMKRVIMMMIIVMILLLLMINITFCSQEWDDSALWLKAGGWKLWIWNPVTEVSVSLLYLLCSNPETRYAIILIKSANNFVNARKKKNINLRDLIWSLWMKSSQWKLRAQQHSPVALYWLLCSTRCFLIEILESDHSNESYWAVLSCSTYHSAVQSGCMLIESVGEIPKCNHLHESFCEALSWGIVYHS